MRRVICRTWERMHADLERPDRDAEHVSRSSRVESVPRDEAQELAVALCERVEGLLQRVDPCNVVGVVAHRRTRGHPEPLVERRSATARAAMVREHLPRDAEQPRDRFLVRDELEAA